MTGSKQQVGSNASASRYEVVHDKVAIRLSPSTKGQMASVALKGQHVTGVPMQIESSPWLQIDQKTKEFYAIDQDADAYILVHGACVGLGELLRWKETVKKPAPAPQASQMVAQKKADNQTTQIAVQKKNGTSNADAEKDILKKVERDDADDTAGPLERLGKPQEYIIVHSKVVQRNKASTSADMVNVFYQGTLVEGVPVDVEGERWLKRENGYILIDGKSVGLGILLEPAADIAEDIVKWAEQHKDAWKSKTVVWTDQTEDELRALEREVHEHVDVMKPGLGSTSVLEMLTKQKLFSEEDLSLGADELAKSLKRYVLLARAGVLLLREPGPTDTNLWRQEEFGSFVTHNVIPLLPFHCRNFVPDDVQRVLVVFHGSYVRGDDLVADAEVFRCMSPETAVVLPEAPIVADEEKELRIWWRLSLADDTAPVKADDGNSFDALCNAGVFKAPADVISRAVATLRSIVSWFGAGVPLIIAGFSQGSLLAAQMLTSVHASSMPKGLIILSGLMQSFSLPVGFSSALALHGDEDDKVPIEHVRKVASDMHNKSLVLLEIPGLGHEISQRCLDKILDFCNTVAPVENKLQAVDDQAKVTEIRQARVLTWVKSFSRNAIMFDNELLLSHILIKDMVTLGPESPCLGASKLRYHVYDVPESRGMVLLFHGKISNLLRDTAELAQAYAKAFKLSVVVIDYRQKFSTFLVDAQIALEAVEELSRSNTKPIIIHCIGIGAMLGIHCAMVAMALPDVVKQRFKLLVLDAAVSVFKALPSVPTGCIAVDPIGNDAKMQYVGMPICLLGGEDACSGQRVQPKHMIIFQRAIDNFVGDETLKQEDITIIEDVALVDRGANVRLNMDLYGAVARALETRHRGPSSKHIDKLMTAISDDGDAVNTTDAAEMIKICGELVAMCYQAEIVAKAWQIRSMAADQRDQKFLELMTDACHPILQKYKTFAEDGFPKFDRVATLMAVDDKALREALEKLRMCSPTSLDSIVEQKQADTRFVGIPRLEQLHMNLEKSLREWQSYRTKEAILAKMKASSGKKNVQLFAAEITAELNAQAVSEFKCDSESAMRTCYQRWMAVDPSLGLKIKMIEKAVAATTASVMAELASDEQRKAAAIVDRVDQTHLDAKAAPPYEPKGNPEMKVVVYIDKELDLKSELTVRKGTTIASLKIQIAKEDPTGESDPLQMYLKGEGFTYPMSDGALVTERLGALELCDPPKQTLPSCTRTVSLECQKEIIEFCATKEFQIELLTALENANGDKNAPEFQMARAQAMMKAQLPSAKKHGFGEKSLGIKQMVTAISQFTGDAESDENSMTLQKLSMM